jgi:hypothetical protein
MKSQRDAVSKVIQLFHGQIRPILSGGKLLLFCFPDDFIHTDFCISDIGAEECCPCDFPAAPHPDFENIPTVAEEMFTRFGVLTYFQQHYSNLMPYQY